MCVHFSDQLEELALQEPSLKSFCVWEGADLLRPHSASPATCHRESDRATVAPLWTPFYDSLRELAPDGSRFEMCTDLAGSCSFTEQFLSVLVVVHDQ